MLDIKELESMESDNKSVTIDDSSVISFSEKSIISASTMALNQEGDFLGDDHSPNPLQDLDTIHHKNNNIFQYDIDEEAQDSQGIGA